MDRATQEHIDSHLDDTLKDLLTLTAQPSVSAQEWGLYECAAVVADELTKAGLKAEIMSTGDSRYPSVYAEAKGASNNTLLFYNHFDVQPAEPLNLWDSPPFEPGQRGEYLFGRGIADDKGHLTARIATIKSIMATQGELPCNVKFIVEGAEEIGSPGFHDFVAQNTDKFKADVCIWEGGGVSWDGRPMLTLGVKGLLYVELECVAAGSDSHSSYAPVVPNPAWRLVWALNTLKDASENVMLRGFYDRVRPALENEVEALKGLPDEVDRFKGYFGVEMFLGEASGYEFRRKLLMDPTCNIAGIDSGYTGEGSKTVLPAVAKMKIDFRLVPDQSPDEVAASLRAHLDEQGFSDISIKIMGSEHPARTSIDHSWVKLVGNAAQSVYGVAPYLQPNMTGTGPQYPIQELLSVPVASCGIDYPGNRMHAPNENIRRDYFRMGMLHTAEVLEQFGKQAHV